MLGLLALFGAVLAGSMVDLSPRAGNQAEDDAPDEDSADEDSPGGTDDDTQAVISLDLLGKVGMAADGDTSNGGLVQSDDSPVAPAEDLQLQGGDLADDMNGGGGNDQIFGGDGCDQINGGAGADSLAGGGGDLVRGGAGDDWLSGEDGNDSLHGEDGADQIDGGAGNDALFGHEGDDRLIGGAGDDALAGGGGDDRLDGGAGDDALAGGSGADWLAAGEGADTLDGGAGDDVLLGQTAGHGDAAVDFLNGGSGDDTLWLGAGDYGHGGEGADCFTLLDIGANDAPMQICDFNPDEDQLVVFYDASLHPDPQLSVAASENGDATTLLMDGVPLACLTNGATLDLTRISLRAA